MQVTEIVVTSALTSTVIAGAVSALLTHVSDKRLLRLEKHLSTVYDLIRERERQKSQTFSKFAGTIHEVRNLAREITNRIQVANTPLGEDVLAELRPAVRGLESDIYAFRLTLEVEGVFQGIHAFKNAAKAFVGLVRDFLHDSAHLGDGNRTRLINDIQLNYEGIDHQYADIIQRLAQSESKDDISLALHP
jgi:hypothetical protein